MQALEERAFARVLGRVEDVDGVQILARRKRGDLLAVHRLDFDRVRDERQVDGERGHDREVGDVGVGRARELDLAGRLFAFVDDDGTFHLVDPVDANADAQVATLLRSDERRVMHRDDVGEHESGCGHHW